MTTASVPPSSASIRRLTRSLRSWVSAMYPDMSVLGIRAATLMRALGPNRLIHAESPISLDHRRHCVLLIEGPGQWVERSVR